MKKAYITLFLAGISLSLFAQNIEKLEKFNISFETAEKVSQYNTESNTDSIIGFENNNYAIDLAIISTQNNSVSEISDLKNTAHALAKNMECIDIKEGDKLPNIGKGYYVTAHQKENNKSYPVVILTFINNKHNLAYDVTIYCYNMNIDEGVHIAKSFKFLK